MLWIVNISVYFVWDWGQSAVNKSSTAINLEACNFWNKQNLSLFKYLILQTLNTNLTLKSIISFFTYWVLHFRRINQDRTLRPLASPSTFPPPTYSSGTRLLNPSPRHDHLYIWLWDEKKSVLTKSFISLKYTKST